MGFELTKFALPANIFSRDHVITLSNYKAEGFCREYEVWPNIHGLEHDILEISSCDHLTIRLRARNVCEVIADEGESRVNYRFIEIESE